MSLRRLVCLSLLLAACGRSSLMGGSPTDCPPGMLNPDGTCGRDLGPDLAPVCDPGEDACLGNCGQPGCCGCQVCISSPLCQPKDMGGDAGDLCADPKNCTRPECLGDPRCHVLGTEICNNALDDDDDGLADCDDPDCATFPLCKPHVCDANNPDCADPACVDHPRCQDLKCKPTVDFGTLSPMGSSVTRMMNTTGARDVAVTPCAPGGAGMVVGKFTLSGPADLTLSFSQPSGRDHVFGLFRAGINQACGQNPVGCYDPKSATSGSHTWAALPPGDYYVITQPFSSQGQGAVSVTLSTPSQPEVCNNGVDDNNNGLIDCADSACAAHPNCISSTCVPDVNLGALVVNGPAKDASFFTTGGDTDEDLTCQAQKGGQAVVVRFTLRETAGILLRWAQTGDHVVGLFRSPQPGLTCDAHQLSCYDPSGRNQDTVAWGEYPPGDYLLIFKALQPGAEGQVDISVSAYRNRKIELCHNGIDDDGNGLIDCDDPACTGVAGCSAPYCMPHRQLGTMDVGDTRTLSFNVKNDGVAGFDTSCGVGGGKGMVAQLTVPTQGMGGGMGIGFDCSQSGDHVIALFAAGGPREPCDTHELVCADPKTLPFGCGYVVPNLQPGTYNVIVAGFQPGTEGTMNLTLSIVDDRQLEICNNNRDDDNDGFTDCLDRKCATSPHCAQNQCRPDTTIDPVPLTGANVFRLVQTAMNGVRGQVPCATTPGGQTAVVELRLTAKADLKLSWNQLGNHDFALFSHEGAQLPCDAGSPVGTCVKSMGAQSGMASFSAVPQGRYYLVIQADQPDGMTQHSGSVNIALSGMPSP